MGNIKRYYVDNAAYFLTTVTEGRIKIFLDPLHCKILLVTIEYYKLILDYKLYGFCIMQDHLHMVIQPVGRYTFSYIMQMIKGTFSRKLNKLHNWKENVWQKGFYDECICDTVELVKKLEYMHNNPVKANYVTSAEEYPYSSYNPYFKTDFTLNSIIEIDKLVL